MSVLAFVGLGYSSAASGSQQAGKDGAGGPSAAVPTASVVAATSSASAGGGGVPVSHRGPTGVPIAPLSAREVGKAPTPMRLRVELEEVLARTEKEKMELQAQLAKASAAATSSSDAPPPWMLSFMTGQKSQLGALNQTIQTNADRSDKIIGSLAEDFKGMKVHDPFNPLQSTQF